MTNICRCKDNTSLQRHDTTHAKDSGFREERDDEDASVHHLRNGHAPVYMEWSLRTTVRGKRCTWVQRHAAYDPRNISLYTRSRWLWLKAMHLGTKTRGL